MRLIKGILLLGLALFVIALGSAYWLLGTAGGTQWLLARLDARAPDGLVLGEATGSLLHGIRMDSLEWRSETVRLKARDVRVAVELLPLLGRHLVIESVAAAELELHILDRETKEPRDGPFAVALPLDITARDASVAHFRYTQGTFDRAAQDVSLAGSLRGSRLRVRHLGFRSDWLDLDASGTARLADPFDIDADATWRWKDLDGEPLAGALHVDGDWQAYEVENELTEPIAISTTGTMAITPNGLFADLANDWRQLSWTIQQGTVNSSGGTLAVRGTPDDFALELDARAGLDDRPESRLKVRGDVQRTDRAAIDLAYDVSALDASYLDPGLSGELSASGQVGGVLGNGGASLDIRIDDLRGTINDHALEGAASGQLDGKRVRIAESWVRQGDNTIRLQGTVTDPLDVDIEVEFNALEQLVPQLSGSLTGRGSVEGSYSQPFVDAEIVAAEFIGGGLNLDRATVSVTGNPANHTITARAAGYEAELVASASARLLEGTWSGTITQLGATSSRLGTWSAVEPGEVTVSNQLTSIAPICLQRSAGEGSACFSARLAAGSDNEFDLTVDGFPVAALPLGLPPDVQVTGVVRAHAHAQTRAGKPSVDAEVELLDTALDTTYMDERVSIAVTGAHGRATVEDGRLESSFRFELADDAGGASATLTIPDIAADEPLLDGRGKVVFGDVMLFAILVPGIAEPTGRIDGTFTVSGTASAPSFLGTIRLADGAFGVRQTGIRVRDLNLELSQAQPGRIRLSGTANSGRGSLAVEGHTSIGTDTGMRAEITLSGEDFELARLPDWQISASPSITAVIDERSTRITGDLAIPRASVTMREAPVSAVRPSSDVVVHREESTEPAGRRRVDVDVRTSLGDDVDFTGFGLTSGLTGSVRLRGGTHAPFVAQGKVSLVGGRYKAYGQELTIERGELLFNGPLDNPLLDIRAVREVRDVKAGIQLSGTPTRLQSVVYSDPPMSDAEVLAYLLTGRPLGESTSASDGEVLNRAAFALGLSGAGFVTSQIRSELGLETLTIEGTGDDSKLVAGKRLNDRLLVEYGYGLIDKLGTLLLRYQLNEHLVLESRTGTVNTFDVVYRRRKK